MGYQALYRKYRPSTFDDFIDQDNVKKILVNSIKNNKISHAYLFYGPRGIGKTSMAKIFAKAINCLNFNDNLDVCDKCENCNEANNQSVDIIEIDAASNNGVDQIRDLRNRISVVPSKLKYKVYIIDEVHMLTNSAFNALLKTLEEPPSHVVFILATTEFYEVPETIVSRCQCFGFGRITLNSLVDRLKYISQKENININDDAVLEIAQYSNGGLRDAIGMLDKLRSFTSDLITSDTFKLINGMISQEDIVNFYNDVLSNNVKELMDIVDKIDKEGYDFKNFVERVMIYARDKILSYYIDNLKNDFDVHLNVKLVEILNNILNRLKDAINPIVIVQIYILEFINNNVVVCNNAENDDKKNISQEIKVIQNRDNKTEKNISREIKNNTFNADTNQKVLGNNTKEKIKNKSLVVVNENIKKVRINNALATANIKYKNELIDKWNILDKYFLNDKYGRVSQLLSDTKPMVVGLDYLILTTSSMGLVDNIYMNIDVVEDFIASIYRKLNIVVLNEDEFEIVKNKYIEDKKNNIVYQIQEEYDKLVDVQNNLINQALDVFGSDLVEIE